MKKKWIVPIVIWGILLLSFIISVRSSKIATDLLNHYKDFVTITRVTEEQMAMEFARSYVVEYVRMDPKEPPEERINRLKSFNDKMMESYRIQDITTPYFPSSSSVVSCEKSGASYSVEVLVIGSQGKALCFNANIGINKGYPYAKSIPLLVPVPSVAGDTIQLYSNSTNAEIKVFVQRFLESYLQGTGLADTSIYTVQGSNIRPVGGTKLVEVSNVVSDSTSKQPENIQVLFYANYQGATLKQTALIKLKWDNNKPLVASIKPL